MEAKDTILNVGQILEDNLIDHIPYGLFSILGKQAEISFKAGMKKVVEWAEENDPNNKFWQSRCWQEFLKSEGIE